MKNHNKNFLYFMDFPFLAFKLAAYVDTTITLYIDSEISNNFMFQFANDLQSLRIGDVQTTSSQVTIKILSQPNPNST